MTSSLNSSQPILKSAVMASGLKIDSCMKFKTIKALEGDVIQINENMSLRYGRVAEDLGPVWQAIPSEPGNLPIEEGNYVPVTEDVWFVLENQQWRIMSQKEHVEASREAFISKAHNEDHFSRP